MIRTGDFAFATLFPGANVKINLDMRGNRLAFDRAIQSHGRRIPDIEGFRSDLATGIPALNEIDLLWVHACSNKRELARSNLVAVRLQQCCQPFWVGLEQTPHRRQSINSRRLP
jgi:hypothetical protein